MALWEAGKAPRAVGSLQGLTLHGGPGQGWGEDSVTPGSNVSKEPSLSFCEADLFAFTVTLFTPFHPFIGLRSLFSSCGGVGGRL